MTRSQLLHRGSSLTLVMVITGLSLAGCNKPTVPADAQQAPAPTAALALASDPSAPPLADAPTANGPAPGAAGPCGAPRAAPETDTPSSIAATR